ncbi:exported hypothetical protein [Verrucomicrobia bacterium]|nr:exported hypothetical protein [Verrucomicrobiota bacterium]
MKTKLPFSLLARPLAFVLPAFVLFTATPRALAQTNATISAADFQRMVYSANLHSQLALKPELEACLRVLLEMQRRNPHASTPALVGLLTNALQLYRTNAPDYIRTSGYADEILAAYLDTLRQVPARTNFVSADLSLLNNFMLSAADRTNSTLSAPSPSALLMSLADSGNQRIFRSAAEPIKRQALVNDCMARARTNSSFALAMDWLLKPETQVALADSPAAIIGNTNSILGNSPTMTNFLAISLTNLNGGLTVSSTLLTNLFNSEMQSIWDSINANLTLLAQVNQSQSDPLAYLTNQAAIQANLDLLAAVQQGLPATIASATAAILVQSQLILDNTCASQVEQIVGAFGDLAIGIGGVCHGDTCGLESVMSGGMDLFNIFTGTKSAGEEMADQIANLQTMIGDLSANMNYRFDRVDQSLTSIFNLLEQQFSQIQIDWVNNQAQGATLLADVNDVRSGILNLQTNIDRLESQIFDDFQQSQRDTLLSDMNGSLFYEATHPYSGPMTWSAYSPNDGPENTFYTYATGLAADGLCSPSNGFFSSLEAQLTSLPLDANLNYLYTFLSGLGTTPGGITPLANPRDWFYGAYAYLQLSVENPMLFRGVNLRIPDIIGVGHNLTNFFRSLIFASGTNINWPLYTDLETFYTNCLSNFNAQISSTEETYAANPNLGFALDAWRQWDTTAPRINASNTTMMLVAAPTPRIAAGSYHSLALKSDGTVVAWGDNSTGETNIPADATNVVAIATGFSHNLALKGDGTVVGWGWNAYGQTNVPPGLTSVVGIAAGNYHSLSLLADGTVVGWGYNQYGQATGVPNPVSPYLSSGPVSLAGQTLSNVVAIAAGSSHSLALKADGTVVAWGYNGDGEANIPAGLTNVVSVSAGAWHSLALQANGTVIAWGLNNHGQATIPAGLSNVVAVAGGRFHTLALLPGGTVVAWGAGLTNNPGDSFDYGQSIIPSGVGKVVALAAGGYHSTALRADGTVLSWGDGSYGLSSPPASLAYPLDRAHIAAGGLHSLALKADGTVVGWGAGAPGTSGGINIYGQATIPAGLTNVVAVSAGYYHSLALKADGTVVGWGAGSPGTSGGNNNGQATIPSGLNNVVAIAAGAYHSLALRADGTVVAWGASGIFGDTTVPAGLSDVVAIAAAYDISMALKTDGTVVLWGDPGLVNAAPNITDAVAISAGLSHCLVLQADGTLAGWGYVGRTVCQVWEFIQQSGVVAIASGMCFDLALLADGTVAAWGYDDDGEFTALGTLTNVVAISGGGFHSLALLADGTVVGSGCGGPGTSGGYNFAQTTIPANVVELDAWGKYPPGLWNVPSVSNPVTAVGAGSAHCLAVTSDHSPVAWGMNTWQQATIPTQAQSGIQAVAGGLGHSLALTTNGSVLAWGLNDFGQGSVPWQAQSGVVAISAGSKHNLALLNNGNVVAWGLNGCDQTNVPPNADGVQVQGQVVAVAAGGEHSLALKANGTVVGWGDNDEGQANGVPSPGSYSSAHLVTFPGQPPLSGAVAIAAGRYHSLALLTNGAAVAWGLNSSGQSSVPLAAQSGVVAIAAGPYHSLALRADGSVVAWGSGPGAFLQPQTWNNSVGIAAGDFHSLLLRTTAASGTTNAQALTFMPAQIPFGVNSLFIGNNTNLVQELSLGGPLYSVGTDVNGAKLLLAAVLELGMPYTLARDDILHAFLYGNTSLADTATAINFLQAQNAQLQASPFALPQELTQVDGLPFQCFTNRLNQCLSNLQATGQSEIPRMVGHTMRLLNLLNDAHTTTPYNTPPPALELSSVSKSPSLLLYGEPYMLYTLQYRDNLGVPGWTTTAITNLHEEQIIAPPLFSGPKSFYRTVTIPPSFQ